MQFRKFRRDLLALALTGLLAACSKTADMANPYANIAQPPLVHARLMAVTLITGNAALGARLAQGGTYQLATLPPNYPPSVGVEARLWDVSEAVAAAEQIYRTPGASGLDIRLLQEVQPAAAPVGVVDPGLRETFYRNVLGVSPPAWPVAGLAADDAQLRAWVYAVPSVVEARTRLRAAAIPVLFDALAISTPYLGDHKLLAIRAPDGATIELVETVAQ